MWPLRTFKIKYSACIIFYYMMLLYRTNSELSSDFLRPSKTRHICNPFSLHHFLLRPDRYQAWLTTVFLLFVSKTISFKCTQNGIFGVMKRVDPTQGTQALQYYFLLSLRGRKKMALLPSEHSISVTTESLPFSLHISTVLYALKS